MSIRNNSKIFKNSQCVKIKNCPSVTDAINALSSSAISILNPFSCIKFKVNDKFYNPNETEFLKLANFIKKFRNSICISFQSTLDQSFLTFWKVKENFQIFSLSIVEYSIEFRKFVLNFLTTSLKSGHTGESPLSHSNKQI